MKTIVIYYPELGNFDENEIDGGIYNNITIDDVVNDIEENQGAAPCFGGMSKEEIIDKHVICFIPLVVSGKTYAERKEDLRDKAIEWSNSVGSYPRWSYGELAIIEGFFETNGRRYGLLKEFQENCIC